MYSPAISQGPCLPFGVGKSAVLQRQSIPDSHPWPTTPPPQPRYSAENVSASHRLGRFPSQLEEAFSVCSIQRDIDPSKVRSHRRTPARKIDLSWMWVPHNTVCFDIF